METKHTAVALLKEWKRLYEEDNAWATLLPDGANKHDDELASISRRLDEMVEGAGITIYENQFIYTKADAWTALDRVAEEYIALAVDLPAIEQQALQEWVLMREGKISGI